MDVQAFVDAIVALAAAAALAVPAVPAGGAAAVTFALMPGAADNNVLNFNKSEAIKLFHKAIQPLDPKFTLAEENLRTFMEQVRERARIYNWDALLTVPVDATTSYHLITHYGMISAEACSTYAADHVGAAFETRKTQDSMMLYQFLLNSLTDAAKLTMLSNKDQYYVGTTPSGVCFLKAIIGRSSINTKAKVSMIRKRIARLADIMKDEFKGNVRNFNIYVADQRDQLLGRGESVPKLLTHLFDAYLNGVPDEEFHRYVELYQNKYDDGEALDAEQLMRDAVNKYKTIQQRKQAMNEGDDKIIALSNKVIKTEDDHDIMSAISELKANIARKSSPEKSKKSRKMPEWKKTAPVKSALWGKKVHHQRKLVKKE